MEKCFFPCSYPFVFSINEGREWIDNKLLSSDSFSAF